MMKKNSSRHASLLLMEIIFAVLFFSLIGAICLKAFVKSHQMSQESLELTQSVYQVSSAAELLQSGLVSEDWIDTEDGFCMYYDADFRICSQEEAGYILCAVKETADRNRLTSWTITMEEVTGLESIYQLKITCYSQEGGLS